MSSDDKELSDAFRLNASLLFQESCPEESRFFLEQHFAGLDIKNPESAALDKTSVCQYCFQWLRPDNHRVRLRAKRRPSARLRRRAGGRALGLVQKRLLRRFWTSASALVSLQMATCHTCSKTSRHKGMNRELLSTFHTPGSGGKHKTPLSAAASTPAKTPGKDKTARRTPRSSTSSGTPGSISSSSSTPSATKTPSKGKNWVVQRLSKLLLREDKPDGKKGSLKDFLSSL
ncbi:UPF0711 protein C18orf21 homolog isoform X1 [Phyllopteryx taeniolatus]|uniref:UPF0711 protein C18orf21 homolog isoform X1 n=1 Tax=Phyllopteryx taeniolatus TaxID=161469 RepID=UPI002AD5315F|nr:UPF0711 protein C18orf21 homolog isoform X1 [Phyllopteryx taeniolatus]